MREKQHTYLPPRGFTLIEFSIVLVVIALVVSALLYSPVLLRSAKVKSIGIDINQYKSSVNAFTMQYGSLPGDMPDASTYWPEAADGATEFIAGEGDYTINGNGDGIINNREDIYAWLMLDIAGVAPGLSTKIKGFKMGWLENINEIFGVPSAWACWPVIPGSNIPPTQLDGGGYQLSHVHDPVYGRVDNAITVGKLEGVSPDTTMRGALLTPVEARLLDEKMDNGSANTGEVAGVDGIGSPTNCVSSGEYLSDDVSESCYLIFWLARN